MFFGGLFIGFGTRLGGVHEWARHLRRVDFGGQVGQRWHVSWPQASPHLVSAY